MKPSGIGVTSYVLALTSSELGSRSALEFPALNTFAVIEFMCLHCIYNCCRQVEAFATLTGALLSAFIGVVNIKGCLNIVPMGKSHFVLLSFHPVRHVILPASLRKKRIEDEYLLFGRPSAVGIAPFQNFRVILFFFRFRNERRVVDAKKATQPTIEAMSAVVVGGQLSLGVQPNLIQHAPKENQTSHRFAI